MNQDLAGVLRLSDWGVLRATGADARSFLQSQLTQDVVHLDHEHARLAGFCSAKGRLQASFVIWADGEDLLLACSADLLPAVLKRLSMFVLRAKCKLSDASAEVALWGQALQGPGSDDAGAGAAWRLFRHGSAVSIQLPDAQTPQGRVGRVLWAAAAGSEPFAGAATLPTLSSEAWAWLEARSGTARVVAATVDQFVPQMVNLELVGGVNFQKGCYPGQEVVARSQYRGTLKRRAFVVAGNELLQPGDEVFHSSDAEQPAGQVVLAGRWGERAAALVSLKIDATHGGELRARRADGPLLALDALPYALPAEAA